MWHDDCMLKMSGERCLTVTVSRSSALIQDQHIPYCVLPDIGDAEIMVSDFEIPRKSEERIESSPRNNLHKKTAETFARCC